MLKILIVEDEPLVALDLRESMEAEFGAEVTVVASVQEARSALRSAFDFAILDVSVEDGTTFELVRELQDAAIPVAFASGHNRSDIPDELLNITFIQKPCCSKAIASAVRASML